MLSSLLFVSLLAAAPAPTAPTTLDVSQPTCVALAGRDADALYLVPRQVCDQRACKLVIELQPVLTHVAPPEPTVIAQGDPLQGALVYNAAARAKVQEALGGFGLPCQSTPIGGALLAGAYRYTLAKQDDVWWARSDNGRSVPLKRIGAEVAAPEVIDGHPAFTRGAFARTTDREGRLVLQFVPYRKLAAPVFSEIIAKPRALAEEGTCVGWDHDTGSMLVRMGDTGDRWLARVDARGTERLARVRDGAAAGLVAMLDSGCTDAELDEPTYDGVVLSIGPSFSDTNIDLSIWSPREKHWNLGALKQVKTQFGPSREEIADILWHPEVQQMVLRVISPPYAEETTERFVWVDLAKKHVLPKE